ncbi:hypothetical protein [Rhodococcus qingshengii]|uniref:hypothetical protein n=1 Tax=Rhodococcus qingshengii TaxID=334542 RepID=UPI001F1477CC|nr:hypothetical protein [Rhodococcus qingshengii]MDJ0441636.1 hypothetical protein [Rhodococcus qingshengii]ULD45165.1 hypothetical protein JKI97_32605 [Rhodococcus qingshengii]
MSDDIERNLDTQSRRLREIEDLVRATLDDQEPTVQLSRGPRHQTYDELTTFNDELRARRDWTEVDLDAALTERQRQAWELWQQKHRLSWSTSDLVAVGAVGVVGMLCTWFDATIDHSIRDRLKPLMSSDIVKGWEKAGKRLPIDHMGPGFGGRAHRIKSAGHDLARPIEAIKQIMASEFRGTAWHSGEAIQVIVGDKFQPVDSAAEAALRLAQHLLADVITPMSLPIPGMSFLYESDSKALRDFALHAYNGLSAGNGWNVRNGIAMPTMTVLVTEILIRTYVHLGVYQQTGTARLNLPQSRRRNELLLASHSLVSAISLGKVAAQITAHYYSGNYVRAIHPSHIRHANIPALLRAGALAGTVVNDAYRASQIPSARSWDDLVTATAQTWQLDLVNGIEKLGSSEVATALDLLD